MENILDSESTCIQVWPPLPLCGILFQRPNFPEIGSAMSKACASANWYRLRWQNCCLASVRCTGRICSVFALVRTGNYGTDPGINTAKRKTEGWQWHSLQLTLLVMLVTGGRAWPVTELVQSDATIICAIMYMNSVHLASTPEYLMLLSCGRCRLCFLELCAHLSGPVCVRLSQAKSNVCA